VILVAEDFGHQVRRYSLIKVLSFRLLQNTVRPIPTPQFWARTMNIPALIGVDFPGDISGKMAIVDGFGGKVYIEPDEETLERYQKQKEEEEKETETSSGTEGQRDYYKGWKENQSVCQHWRCIGCCRGSGKRCQWNWFVPQ